MSEFSQEGQKRKTGCSKFCKHPENHARDERQTYLFDHTVYDCMVEDAAGFQSGREVDHEWKYTRSLPKPFTVHFLGDKFPFSFHIKAQEPSFNPVGHRRPGGCWGSIKLRRFTCETSQVEVRLNSYFSRFGKDSPNEQDMK